MTMRDDKTGALLTELAGRYIAREAGRTTLITPTRTMFGNDRKHATIYLSVFPDDQAEHALAFMMRHRDDFRNFIKHEGRFSVLPFISFELDYGEKNRQRLDEISNELDEDA